ncbi:MAG: hypothetical protein B6U76_09025 [Desulfurococcales archaeon ex4484_217_2]|nr:MAG: hypothetical protein B6U76_09025 [Desulfurococcales archaeon ex4484_217_2]
MALSSRDRLLNAKSVLEEAYKRMLPALGYLINPQVGFAASVFVLTTWLLGKALRGKGFSVEEEEEIIVELDKKIEEKKGKISFLRKALEKAKTSIEKERLRRNIALEEEVLSSLQEEYDLHLLRIEAANKLRELGEARILSKLEKLITKIEKGKEAFKEQYEVVKMLEEKWKSRILEKNILLKILKSG